MPELTLDGKTYQIDQLSEEARAQLISYNFVEAELVKINAQLAIYETAKNSYAKALKAAIEESKYEM